MLRFMPKARSIFWQSSPHSPSPVCWLQKTHKRHPRTQRGTQDPLHQKAGQFPSRGKASGLGLLFFKGKKKKEERVVS